MRPQTIYSNPYLWVDEIQQLVFKCLQILIDTSEDQIKNLQIDYSINKEVYINYGIECMDVELDGINELEMDEPYFETEYYKGIDGSTYHLPSIISNYLPSTIRGYTFISIYSTFEFELDRLCSALYRFMNLTISHKELKDKGIDRSFNYLTKVAKLNLAKEESDWNQIKLLQNIRNMIVHNDHILKFEQKDLKDKLKLIPGISIENDLKIMLNKEFLVHVMAILSSLTSKIGMQLNEINNR
jgi:hypothetical protein